MNRTPLKKKRTGKPRRVLQVCAIRGCKRRADQAMCKTHAKLRADQAWSLYIRNRDGRCMAAEAFPEIRCAGSLQAMHLISRRYAATRYATWNGKAGCAAHHRWLTDRPLEHDEWCDSLWLAGPQVAGSTSRFTGTDLGTMNYRLSWAWCKDEALHGPPMDPLEAIAALAALTQEERHG